MATNQQATVTVIAADDTDSDLDFIDLYDDEEQQLGTRVDAKATRLSRRHNLCSIDDHPVVNQKISSRGSHDRRCSVRERLPLRTLMQAADVPLGVQRGLPLIPVDASAELKLATKMAGDSLEITYLRVFQDWMIGQLHCTEAKRVVQVHALDTSSPVIARFNSCLSGHPTTPVVIAYCVVDAEAIPVLCEQGLAEGTVLYGASTQLDVMEPQCILACAVINDSRATHHRGSGVTGADMLALASGQKGPAAGKKNHRKSQSSAALTAISSGGTRVLCADAVLPLYTVKYELGNNLAYVKKAFNLKRERCDKARTLTRHAGQQLRQVDLLVV
jgi:hypothetical protein